ncbi:alpha/beta hydrolase [Acidobacteriota bacterium]
MGHSKIKCSFVFVIILTAGLISWTCGESGQEKWRGAVELDVEKLLERLDIESEMDSENNPKISRGTFTVFEDRKTQEGRMIQLDVVVLHATGKHKQPDPMFFLAGGPGGDITRGWRNYGDSWIREERDIVLVSQRGTGGDNKLDCEIAASDDNIQGYLDPLFKIETFQACLEDLKSKFDLKQYSTFAAADDLFELRLALGYDKINLSGSSYGTRMALIYMRQHPETVRTATLNGVAPLSFKNPLHHAPSGHEAIQLLIAECANDPDCNSYFPNLEEEFQIILDRLEQEPADVMVTHPASGERVSVKLSKAAFAEALRMIMYSGQGSRMLPFLIHQAFLGDYEPFAQMGIESNRGIRQSLALAMLLCVTCAEDVSRIDPDEITEVTGDSFLGEDRVRQQMAICNIWPKSRLPEDFGQDVSVAVPVLILSGLYDPVTPPKFGADAASHLPLSVHLTVPGSHGVRGPCIRDIQQRFLDSGTVEGLDTSCTDGIQRIRFNLVGNK